MVIGSKFEQHLSFGYQAIVVGRLVAWMGMFEPIPVLSKDLLEDIQVTCRGYKHQRAPS